MNNSINLSHQEQCNQEYLEIIDELAKLRASLARLEQRRDNVYPGTLFYKMEQEHKQMLDDLYDEEN